MKNENKIQYIYGIADNALILGQRLSELCGHGPNLETDIAMTNMALDLLGQTRSYYQYVAQLSGEDKTEDDIAFLRTERQYKNVLLVEQPNRHFGYVIARQFFFDAFHLLVLEELQNSTDQTLAAIAKKGIKEVSYHQRFSSDWIKRLGDGTEESHQKVQEAVDDLWRYTDELFHITDDDKIAIENEIGVNTVAFREKYDQIIREVLEEATITIPETKWFQKGGKQGIHSEHMGYLLSDLQYMQRTYPNMKW
ncbi:1,2-phenylacetyl-CoA epoxidase subunit PaaC [Aquimarina longa]|uniref:1,2-phenylacetyl-CoA epoxidase subunit PaaC n=1 Tax=Aquimarina longa TaxID=1080221 RepID=UPI00078277F0|nr:1,2-phenylacetyl-CoA epoxidase subunit PaaC [Aquimarina longa]